MTTLNALDQSNYDKITEYARLNDEAAQRELAAGNKRMANRCKKTANEWRRVAAEILTSRNVVLV